MKICDTCSEPFDTAAILTVLDQYYCSDWCYFEGREDSKRAVAHYPALLAAARAVVEAWDLWSKIEVPIDAFGVRIDALRAAVADQGPVDATYQPVQPHE